MNPSIEIVHATRALGKSGYIVRCSCGWSLKRPAANTRLANIRAKEHLVRTHQGANLGRSLP